MTSTITPSQWPTFIDLLTLKAGKKGGIYIEGEVRGEAVFMPSRPQAHVTSQPP